MINKIGKFFNNEGGFSLIQIIVVVALIGVLMAVLIPNFGNIFGETKAAGYSVDSNTVYQSLSAETIPENTMPIDSTTLTTMLEDSEFTVAADLTDFNGEDYSGASMGLTSEVVLVFSDDKDNVDYLMFAGTNTDSEIYVMYPNEEGLKFTKSSNGTINKAEGTFDTSTLTAITFN